MIRKLKKLFRKIRVAYYNFGDGPDHEKLQDLEELYASGVDAIGLSEHADRGDVTDTFIRLHPDWEKWAGDGRPGAEKECLLWKKSLGTVTAKKSVTLVGPRKLGHGAGPENAGPKVANRVRLKIGKLRRLHLIVGHQYATVNNRKEAAWLFIHALMNVVRARVGTVIVMGDQNATIKSAFVQALRTLLPSFSNTGPTHDNRAIDFIMVRGGKVLEAWRMKLSSDHKAVLAVVRI